jgi:hypothetical protein
VSLQIENEGNDENDARWTALRTKERNPAQLVSGLAHGFLRTTLAR